MLDSRIPMTGKSLESGLRMGAMISDSIAGQRSRTALQEAQARINAGEDSNVVIQQLMAQDPAAAQQLMNLKQGSMQLNAQAQEVEVLKQKYGMQKLQSAAMPMLGAIMQDDPKVQDKLIDEASSVFKGQSDGIFESLQGIKNLQGVQRADALTGLVKTLRTAGIFPDDPSQMMQGGTALGQNLSLYDQAVASGDMERAELIKRNIDPYSGSFARGAGAGEARLGTERGLNDILSARKAGEVEAVEQTATGQANLKSAQLGAQKAETAVAEDETRKAKQIELSRQTATLAKEIANSPNLGSVTGLAAMTPTLNPESQDLIIKSQQLLALLTADNLKLMSGVLTDKDIEMLQTLSSGMKIDDKGIKGSEQAIRKRLVEIATNIEKTLAGKSGVAPAQQQAPATRNESDILKEYGL